MAINSASLKGTHPDSKYQSLYLEFWIESQNPLTGKTTFGYKAYLKSNVANGTGSANGTGYYTLSNAYSASATGRTWATWTYSSATIIVQGTFTKTHGEDGELPNQKLTITAGGSSALGSATVSVTLPVPGLKNITIPTLMVSSVDMNADIVVGTDAPVETYHHRLYFSFQGISKTLIDAIAAGVKSYTWAPPLSMLGPKIPNTTSGEVTLYLETYSGTELLGTRTAKFTAVVPSSIKPTITSSTVTEGTAALAGKVSVYIKGKSTLSVAMAATATGGATMSSYSITAGDTTINAASGKTGVLTTTGELTITYKATDSRGRVTTTTKKITVLEYTEPKLESFTVYRSNASGVYSPSGNRITVVYKASITSLNHQNAKNYTVKYRPVNTETWTTVQLPNSSYNPNTSYVISGPSPYYMSSSVSYEFEMTVSDSITSSPSIYGAVGTTEVPFQVMPGGIGVAVGKYAELERIFDSAWAIMEQGLLLSEKYSPLGEGTRVNLTLDSAVSGYYTDLGGNFYRKAGNVVVVNIRISCSTAPPNTNLLKLFYQNLPVPSDTEYYRSVPIMDNTAGKALGVSLAATGALSIRYGTTGRAYYDTFVYITA